jgi:hypothetical protein
MSSWVRFLLRALELSKVEGIHRPFRVGPMPDGVLLHGFEADSDEINLGPAPAVAGLNVAGQGQDQLLLQPDAPVEFG